MTSETCGKGLAEHATLPERLAALLSAMADNLRVHQATLDLRDPAAQREHDVYVNLEEQYRGIVTQLEAVAQRMAAARNLPMGRHLPDKLADQSLFDAFANFVRTEEELLDLLRRDLERDRVMLRSAR